MINVVRKMTCREFALRMGSSFSRSGTQSALPLICALFAVLLVSSPVFAQSVQPVPPAAQKPPSPCATPVHRAFDFWIGKWNVTPAGQTAPAGVNRISSQHGGCVIREEYKTNGGYTGMSISFYDAARKIWHQTWMGADGTALFVEGGLNDKGEMVLSNANWPGYVKGTPINRVTWTPSTDGTNVASVRQHWQASKDGGKSWTTVFEGFYTRRSEN